MLATRHKTLKGPVPLSGMGYDGARAVWNPDAPTSRVAYWGAPQTIEVMATAALEDADHFETRQLVEMVCENIDSKDYTSEYLALTYFLLANTRYMRDPKRTELVRAPYVISKQILAGKRPSIDCDDASCWLAAADLSIGGQAEFVTVAFADMRYDGRRQYSHVLTRALEPRTRTWILQDIVAAEKTAQMVRRVKFWDSWPIAA